jgi:hypothetical protein
MPPFARLYNEVNPQIHISLAAQNTKRLHTLSIKTTTPNTQHTITFSAPNTPLSIQPIQYCYKKLETIRHERHGCKSDRWHGLNTDTNSNARHHTIEWGARRPHCVARAALG